MSERDGETPIVLDLRGPRPKKAMIRQWLGWHFVTSDRRIGNGDGRKVIRRRTLSVPSDRALELCKYGLHASPSVYSGLRYAPGSILCRVELIGERVDSEDKSCAYTRRVIAWADADSMLRLWACWCVRQVWDLLTDERSRNAVRVAERFARGKANKQELIAAGAAAEVAARIAAMDAAWAAARYTAMDAARVAAGAAARYAAMDAARVAAGAAAEVAARYAAMDAARVAARYAQEGDLERRAIALMRGRR